MAISSAKRRRQQRRKWLLSEHSKNPRCDFCDVITECPMNCEESDVKRATVDHVVSKHFGGLDLPCNFALACQACNKKKDFTYIEPKRIRRARWY